MARADEATGMRRETPGGRIEVRSGRSARSQSHASSRSPPRPSRGQRVRFYLRSRNTANALVYAVQVGAFWTGPISPLQKKPPMRHVGDQAAERVAVVIGLAVEADAAAGAREQQRAARGRDSGEAR